MESKFFGRVWFADSMLLMDLKPQWSVSGSSVGVFFGGISGKVQAPVHLLCTCTLKKVGRARARPPAHSGFEGGYGGPTRARCADRCVCNQLAGAQPSQPSKGVLRDGIASNEYSSGMLKAGLSRKSSIWLFQKYPV